MQACRSSSIHLTLLLTIEGFAWIVETDCPSPCGSVKWCWSGAKHNPPGGGSVPKQIDFSSYECDCGHQSHFFQNTIKEVKSISHKRTVYLGDSEADEHTIVFKHGEMIEILCPRTDSQRQFRRKKKRTP
jgi:hypothetical protein